MKTLRLLNKKFSLTIFIIFLSLNVFAEDKPVDIWNIKKKTTDENTLDNWEKAIIDLFSNEKKLNYLAKNGSTLIQENYNLNLFNKKVFEVLNLKND